MTVTNQRYRLNYHLMAKSGWINDPNGLSYFKGYYHIFYQYYPYDSEWGPMHWGHARSKDLVHWETLPVALTPGESEDGCFSGSAIEYDGKLWLIYTGHHYTDPTDQEQFYEDQNLAYSTDGIHFTKYEGNPVLRTPVGNTKHFRDPKVWQDSDNFYMVLGSQEENGLGRALLYRSKNLIDWEFILVLSQAIDCDREGFMWECPDLFHLDGQDVLIMSPQGVPVEEFRHKNTNTTVYCLGELNYETAHFERRVMEEIDYGLDFYAPQTTESLDGRRIMIAWMQSWHQNMPTDKYGWVTSMTIPRELSIKGDVMYQWPVREIEKYRSGHIGHESVIFEGSKTLAGVKGRHLDLEMVIDFKEAKYFEIKVMKGEDQETNIVYDVDRHVLSFDRRQSRSGIDGLNYREMPVPLVDGKLSLRLLIDTYSVELFAQEGAHTMTSTVYSDLCAEGIEFIADRTVEMTVHKWELNV